MKINVRGDKVEITESMKNQITEKLNKLNLYFENPENINTYVLIRVRNLYKTIEVTIPTKRFTLRAEETQEDLYPAITEVVNKLERQIRKNKTRLSRKYRNNEKLEINTNFDSDSTELEEKKIKKRKKIEMKPMDEEEAVLQMELLGHDFFVFKNEIEECISVVYKRKNNSYGIINLN
ncbi:MAG: ribosome-associated translation inhibitor RaiA [Bacilli bacterium]|nr:ribosome-associated translation inhibitor RaiA [Bacilli bacterium]